jgi:hypothetical protein
LGGNEYTPYNNPYSIPGTWENVRGALGNLFAFPFWTLPSLAAGIIRGDPYHSGSPVALPNIFSFFGGQKADYPGPESRSSSKLSSAAAIYPEFQPGMGPVTVTPLAAPPSPRPGMGHVTVTPLAAPPPFLPLAFGGKELPYRPILEPVVFPAGTGEFFTPESKRQENVARAQAAILGRDYADEGGGWEEAEESAAAETEALDEMEGGENYGDFNTGGPVIKRRGFRETATSPLAAGSFVDKPLYDRALGRPDMTVTEWFRTR